MEDQTNQSPLTPWLSEFNQRREAIAESVRSFISHLRMLPSPQTEAQTDALLRWRASLFQLPPEPALRTSIESAAGRAAHEVTGPLHDIAPALKELLESLESALTYLGTRAQAGIVGPESLPADTLHREFDTYYVHLRGGLSGLPFNHPLSQAIPDEDLPSDKRICLGDAIKTISLDGTHNAFPPRWLSIEQIRRDCRRRREEEDRQAAEAQRRREEEAARERELAERFKTPEQLRIEALERELAQLKAQRAEPKEEIAPQCV